MKKMYKYILVIALMMFAFIGKVEARDDLGKNSCVDKGTCKLACYYYTTDNTTRFNIYVKDSDYYASIGDGVLKNYYLSYSDPTSSFFLSDAAVGLLDKGSCPTNVYYTTSLTDKVCLSNSNEDFCTKIVSSLTKQNVTIGTRRFTVEKKVNECVNNNTCKLMCQYFGMAKTINIYNTDGGIKVSLNDGELKNTIMYNVFSSITSTPSQALIPSYMNEGKNKQCPSYVYLDMGNKMCFDSENYGCTNIYSNSYKKINTTLSPENFIEDATGNTTGDTKEDSPVYNENNVAECAKGDNPTCTVMCPYEDGTKYAYIYKSTDNKLAVSYSWNKGLLSNNSNLLYYFDTSTDKIFIQPEARNQLEQNGKCPLYWYDDTELQKEICFDNDGKWCKTAGVGDHFESDSEQNVADEQVTVPEDVLEDLEKKSIDCDSVFNKISSEKENVYEVCGFAEESGNNRFFIVLSGNKYILYKGTSDNSNIGTLEEITDEKILSSFSYESTASCVYYEKVYSQTGFTTFSPDKNFFKWDTEMPYVCVARDYSSITGDEQDNTVVDNATCQSIIGEDLINEINSYLLYIKIAVPILIIVMGSIDFGKAFIASDEDAMKKAQKHFIMRLIIGMVIFFIPSILNAFLNIANDVWGIFNDTCGITF